MKRSSRNFGTPIFLNGTPGISMNGGNNIQVLDSTGSSVECLAFGVENASVNFLKVNATATGSHPSIEAKGDDADLDVAVTPKGTGLVDLQAATDVSGELTLIGANKWIGAEAPGGDSFAVANFMSVDNSVNVLSFTSAATGNFPGIAAQGTDSDVNLQLGGKGSGRVQATSDFQVDTDKVIGSLGDTVVEFIPQASAVNWIQIGNQATGNSPTIQATGTDADVDITLTPKGIGGVIANAELFAASNLVFQQAGAQLWVESPATGGKSAIQLNSEDNAVNYLDVTGTATGNDVVVQAAGTDSDIGLDFQAKGTGNVSVNGVTLLVADYAGINIDDNTTETNMPLVSSLKKVTAFDTDLPSSVSTPDQTRSEITVGSTADYEINFSFTGRAAGAGKTFTFQAFELEPTVNITNVTSANPVVVSASGHNLSNGDQVAIKDVVGTTEVNDRIFTVAGVSGDTFSLKDDDDVDIDGSGFTAYSSAGTTQKATLISLYDKKFVVANDEEMFSGSTFASLTANNFVQFYAANMTDATAFTFLIGNFTIRRLS